MFPSLDRASWLAPSKNRRSALLRLHIPMESSNLIEKTMALLQRAFDRTRILSWIQCKGLLQQVTAFLAISYLLGILSAKVVVGASTLNRSCALLSLQLTELRRTLGCKRFLICDGCWSLHRSKLSSGFFGSVQTTPFQLEDTRTNS